MTRIGIILGSTRLSRSGEQVATWVYDMASRRSSAEFELIDLRDYPLPHLDEPLPPSMGQYHNEHTNWWADTIASFDGFIMVTPEYNHSTSGSLKNALDYLYAEWNNKAAGFVSYGIAGGARAAEHLRLVCGELQMADVRQQVTTQGKPLLEAFDTFTLRRLWIRQYDPSADLAACGPLFCMAGERVALAFDPRTGAGRPFPSYPTVLATASTSLPNALSNERYARPAGCTLPRNIRT
jgi:NAD(P)H-dependent FMN reductase